MALALQDRQEKFIVMDDLSNGFSRAVPEGIKLIVGNSGDYEQVTQVLRTHNVDTIIHFAATLITPGLYDRPLEYYRINAENSRGVLQAAADAGVKRFIYSGSSAVYGNPIVDPVPETTPPAPVTPYGKSKLIMEYMLNDIAAVSDMKYVILRYFNVAGADPLGRHGQISTKTTLLVQLAVQSALGIHDHKFKIYGTDYPTKDGTCIRDYLHVSDLIDAHVLALDYLRDGCENSTFNVGYGQGYSVRDILSTVKRITGMDFPVEDGPRREGDPVQVVAEASLIRQKLGWSPRFNDIEKIVQDAYQWELKQQKRRQLLSQK